MKQVKCPNCHRKRGVSNDTIMAICPACQKKMEEYDEIKDKIKKRNFKEDLKNSKKSEESWNIIFRRIFGEDVDINWREDMTSQISFGSDVLIKTNKGRKFSIDVKTRSNKYFGLETWPIEIAHHIYENENRSKKIETKEGWLYCSTSDFIFYGTKNKKGNKIIEVCGFSLTPFKNDDFKSEISKLKNAWAATEFSNGNYQLTLNKKVNLKFLKNNADRFWYFKLGGGLDDYF